jgi:hypothetical protein
MPASLPLTAFESYMWADDAPGHPMTALVEVGYSGRIDRAHFEAALAEVLGQHPLLRALIDGCGRRACWVFPDGARPFLSWGAEDEPLGYPGGAEYIDLAREIGLRVWVRAGDESGRVVLQLHHACTDGIGVMTFLLDLLRAYDRRVSGAGDMPRRDGRLLAERGRFFRRPWLGRLRMLGGLVGSFAAWRLAKPAALSDDGAADRGPTGPMSSILSRSLDEGRLGDLLRAARAADATLNDLLLRDLFLVLREHVRPRTRPGECLCVCMPANLRGPADAALPAANKMAISFLRRPPGDCDDPAGLLRGLRRETLLIKKIRRGIRLIEVVRWAVAVTGAVPHRFLNKRMATAVLSNLGRVGGPDAGLPADAEGRLLCGGLTIERIVTAPNGRAGTSAVLVVLTYAGRLNVCLWFDRRVLSEASADRLLDDYLARLTEAAATAAPAAVG